MLIFANFCYNINMKEILIIADGIVAKQFLERVCTDSTSDNNYIVVYYNDKSIIDKKAESVKYFKFDPTSFSKLRSIFNKNIVEVFIVVKKKFDAEESYKNIRLLSKDIHIVLLDSWDIKSNDTNLSLLNTQDILSSRLFDFLPNVSVIAQNVGLGIGEIMEIDVPFGSSYAYRHISNIKQKNWKIAALYRANSLILPTKATVILPNDMLLVIGDPNILRGVNISIKQELGLFPLPYGKNIYIIVDMLQNNEEEISGMINSAFLLHSTINNTKLIIKLINPTYSKCFDKIKGYDKGSTKVFIDYESDDFEKTLESDLEIANIGLMVTNNKMFKKYKNTFHKIKIPIFKIGNYDFSKIKNSIVLSEENADLEKLSAAIFDISAQLKLNIELYDYDPEKADKNRELIQHFMNLATMFNRDIKIVKPQNNPIIDLEHRTDIMQFIPFSEEVKNAGFLSLFSTSFQKLHYKLKNSYQVYMPVG